MDMEKSEDCTTVEGNEEGLKISDVVSENYDEWSDIDDSR